jgi:hypothetical protein
MAQWDYADGEYDGDFGGPNPFLPEIRRAFSDTYYQRSTFRPPRACEVLQKATKGYCTQHDLDRVALVSRSWRAELGRQPLAWRVVRSAPALLTRGMGVSEDDVARMRGIGIASGVVPEGGYEIGEGLPTSIRQREAWTSDQEILRARVEYLQRVHGRFDDWPDDLWDQLRAAEFLEQVGGRADAQSVRAVAGSLWADARRGLRQSKWDTTQTRVTDADVLRSSDGVLVWASRWRKGEARWAQDQLDLNRIVSCTGLPPRAWGGGLDWRVTKRVDGGQPDAGATTRSAPFTAGSADGGTSQQRRCGQWRTMRLSRRRRVGGSAVPSGSGRRHGGQRGRARKAVSACRRTGWLRARRRIGCG